MQQNSKTLPLLESIVGINKCPVLSVYPFTTCFHCKKSGRQDNELVIKGFDDMTLATASELWIDLLEYLLSVGDQFVRWRDEWQWHGKDGYQMVTRNVSPMNGQLDQWIHAWMPSSQHCSHSTLDTALDRLYRNINDPKYRVIKSLLLQITIKIVPVWHQFVLSPPDLRLLNRTCE